MKTQVSASIRKSHTGRDEVLQPIAGYHAPVWKQILYFATVLSTLGVSYLFAMLCPSVMVLLRLRPCSLRSASFVSFQLSDGQVLLLRVFSAAYGRVVPAAGLRQGKGTALQLVQLSEYWYSHNLTSGMFERVPRMPSDLPQQLNRALEALAAIDEGAEWTTFNSSRSWSRHQRLMLYGDNHYRFSRPVFITLVLTELANPDMLFPIVILGLWMYCLQYFAFPAVLLAILLVGTAISVSLTYRQRRTLANICSQTYVVPYVRKGYVRATIARRLIPGDVVVVQQGIAVCDMVLLRGNCLVEDSMISGDAVQLRKHPFVLNSCNNASYDPDVHSASTILSGAIVHQVWNDSDEPDECLAMVVRTGINAATGKMILSLFDRPWTLRGMRTPMGFHLKDMAKFYTLVGLVQMTIYLVTLGPDVAQSKGSAKNALLELLLSVINTARPVLPAVLVFVRVVALVRLRYQGLIVSDTQKMLTAGHLDVVLFDKTGTLTVDQGRLHGIITCDHGKLDKLKTESVEWAPDLKKMLAVCNDLVPLTKGQLVGSLDEKRAFAAVEASFVGKNTVCLPLRVGRKEVVRQVQMEILQRFEYDATMMMSGVIAKSNSTTHCERAQVLIKGDPFEVCQLADPDSLPQDWLKALMYWMALGYRVLGLAEGQILANSKQDLSKITLQNIRQHTYGMRVLGFAVISNPLRSDSTAAITELQDRGRLHTIMVTGDHHITAMAVAQVTGMLDANRPQIVIAQTEELYMAPVLPAEGTTASRPEDHYAQLLHSRSAVPLESQTLAETVSQPQGGSSRSKSLSQIEVGALNHVSGARVSSKPLVPKPAFQPASPQQAAELKPDHLPARPASLVPALIHGSSNSLARARSSEPFSLHQLLAHTDTHNLADLRQPASAEPDLQQDGLSFLIRKEGRMAPLSRKEAIPMIAMGHQCIITGRVFDHLVQHADPAFMEAVLHNVAVCARMKAYQKAHLVQLLSSQGLTVSSTRKFKGLGHVVGYCGDGINDVPALQAADVGVAIGQSLAVAGAPVASLSSSIMAVCALVREARCSLAVTYSLFKYITLFGFIVGILEAIFDFSDSADEVFSSVGVSTNSTDSTIHQFSVANYISLLVALGFVCTRASPHLHPVRPSPRLISINVLAPIALFMGYFAVGQGIAAVLVQRQSWYHGDQSKVPLLATGMVMGLSHLLAPAISFTIDMRPHCLGLRHNMLVPSLVFALLVAGIVWVLVPGAFGNGLLEQGQLPLRFRVELLLFFAGNVFVLIILVRLLRRCIEHLHARRMRKISGAFYVPASTESGGSRPPGRKSFDGRTALRRSTGSTDIGDWLRRTASAVGDLSTFLPSGRSNKVTQDQFQA